MCVIEVENMKNKTNSLMNKSKLRSCIGNIYINDNLTKKEQQIQVEIREWVKEEEKRE